jgi:hypothetical protein
MKAKQKSAPVVELQSAVELYSKDDSVAAFGIVEAQGDDQLRVKLCFANGGTLPEWRQGAVLQCLMEAADGRYHTESVVMKRSDEILWLHMPPLSTRIDRRKAPRVTGGFPVNYAMDGGEGMAVCLDVSETGMRLRLLNEAPVSSKMELYFNLPADPMPIRTQAVIVQVCGPDGQSFGVNAGIKYAGMAQEDRMRIARHTRPLRGAPPIPVEPDSSMISKSIREVLEAPA